ncbi:hypothetical protein WA158_008343 [Blastocystis sp. Blastoise]
MSQNDEFFDGLLILCNNTIYLDSILLRKEYLPNNPIKELAALSDSQEIVSICDEIKVHTNDIVTNILSKVGETSYSPPLRTNYMNMILEEAIHKIIFAHTGKNYCIKICQFIPAAIRVKFSNLFNIETKNGKNQYVCIENNDTNVVCLSSFIAKKLCSESCKYHDFMCINSIVRTYLSDKRKNNLLEKLLGFKEIINESLCNDEIVAKKTLFDEFEWSIDGTKIKILKIQDKNFRIHFYTLDDGLFLSNDLSKAYNRHMRMFMKNPNDIFPFFEKNTSSNAKKNDLFYLDIASDQVNLEASKNPMMVVEEIQNDDEMNTVTNDIIISTPLKNIEKPLSDTKKAIKRKKHIISKKKISKNVSK